MKKRILTIVIVISFLLSSVCFVNAEEVTGVMAWFKVYDVISLEENPKVTGLYGYEETAYICQSPVKVEVIADIASGLGAIQMMMVDGKMTMPTAGYGIKGDYFQEPEIIYIEKPGLYWVSVGDKELSGVDHVNIIVKGEAQPTASTVYIDGKETAFDAYNIGDNNYFKLRDIAMALKDSEKEFNVGWDAEKAAISLEKNTTYTVVGGELESGSATAAEAIPNLSSTYLDGEAYGFISYTINDNNYFKLRDLGDAFGFAVEWDGATNSIHINTTNS